MTNLANLMVVLTLLNTIVAAMFYAAGYQKTGATLIVSNLITNGTILYILL